MDGVASLAHLGTLARLKRWLSPRRGSVIHGLCELGKQHAVELVARWADGPSFYRVLHPARRFVQMRAVVKLAVRHMWLEVWHVGSQLHGIDVMHAKLLKTRRVNQACFALGIYPVPRGGCGGVLARIERL